MGKCRHLEDGHPGALDVEQLLHGLGPAQLLAQAGQVEVDLFPLRLKEGCRYKFSVVFSIFSKYPALLDNVKGRA